MSETAYIIWKDEYSVGRADMDAQHKAILGLINRLYAVRLDRSAADKISPMFEGLLQFAALHFEQEERLLSMGGDPNLDLHKAAHEELAQTTRKMAQRFLTTKEDIAFDLLAFLRKWWTGHEAGMDQKSKTFLPPQPAPQAP